MDRALLVKNAAPGDQDQGQPTLAELACLLTDDKPLDRATRNSWEDIESFLVVCPAGWIPRR
jgi:hypothetical protein